MKFNRTDLNQSEIAKALAKVGASVTSLTSVKDGCPDLLVGFRGFNYLMEIKNPKISHSLTKAQKLWHQRWAGKVHIVQTIDEALIIVGVLKIRAE